MATNQTKVIISAEDKTGAALASVKNNLKTLEGSFAGLDSIASRLPLLGTAITAAFGSVSLTGLVKNSIDAADNLNDLSQSVGISIKDLATWDLAARQSGTSLESVAKGVKGLSTYMVENGAALKAAGINATTANGALIELADLFQAMPDGIEKTNLAVKLFGKAGMDMIPMLNQGSAGLAEAAAKAEAYGERMAKLAPQADAFNDQLEELALQSRTAGINITSYLMPGLVGLATWFNDLAAGGERAATALEFLSEKSPLFAALVKFNKLLTGGEARAKPFSGEKDPLGLPLSDMQRAQKELTDFDRATDAYLKERDARRRAGTLADKATGGAGGKAKKASAGIIGPDDVLYNIQEAVEKQSRAAIIAADKESDALEAKARAMDELHMKRIEMYRIETEGEEAVRESLEKSIAKVDDLSQFTIEAARNMQDAMADGFFSIMQGEFDNMGDQWKRTIDRMVANAMAANLSQYLLGDFGTTGNLGGVVGGLFKGGSGGGDAGSGFMSWFGNLLPKFAEGTPFVPQTGLAIVHQGERIVPASQNKPGGMGMTNVFNFTLSAPSDRRTQEQVAAMAGMGIQRALARNT